MKLSKSNKQVIKSLSKAHELEEDELLDIIVKFGLLSLLKEVEFYGSLEEANKCLHNLVGRN